QGASAAAGRRRDRGAGHERQDPGDVLTVRVLDVAPPIGAHIQIRGGLAKGGLAYTDAVRAAAVQVFGRNPRGWKLTAADPTQDSLFVAGCAERGVPSFIHAPFLVNVGSPTEATVEQSTASIPPNPPPGPPTGLRGGWGARVP